MTKLITKTFLLSIMLLMLTACGSSDSEDDSEESTESALLVTGKINYEYACASCHGLDGSGNDPIVIGSCSHVDCTDVEALGEYIEAYMPNNDTQSCTLEGEYSCALTTATYIANNFSSEVAGTEAPDLEVGQEYYEAQCSSCHGSLGSGTYPMNPDNCLVANCDSLTTVTAYVNAQMPQGGVGSCTSEGEDSCAATTAAYFLNSFSTVTEEVEEETTTEDETPTDDDEPADDTPADDGEDPVDLTPTTDEPTDEEVTLTQGKIDYDASCAGCHGSDGTDTSRPITVGSCTATDCTDQAILEDYIEEYMPRGSIGSCPVTGDDGCAETTAAYIINGFSTEVSE